MPTSQSVETTPADKKGMTLAELTEFVNQCQHAHVPSTTRIKAQVTMGGGLKSLKTGEA